jgi:hypothetical protein
MNRQDLIRRLRERHDIGIHKILVEAADALEADEALLRQALDWIELGETCDPHKKWPDLHEQLKYELRERLEGK